MTAMKNSIIKYINLLILIIALMSQSTVYASGASSPTLLYLNANPRILSLTEGKSTTVTVSGTYTDGITKKLTNCVWTSSDTSVATVSKGKILGVSEGSAIITASIDSTSVDIDVTVNSASSVALLSLTASPNNVTIKKGNSQTITVTGTYSDGAVETVTSKCTWTTSDASVATVSKGTIKGIDAGSTVITASIGSKNVVIEVNINSQAIWITSWKASQNAVTIAPGKSKAVTINATYSDNSKKTLTSEFAWTTDDPSIATVKNGKITGIAPGDTYVTAAYGLKSVAIRVTVSGPPELEYLSVSSDYITLAEGKSQSVTVTGTYSDETKKNLTAKCKWTYGDIVSVSNGKITGISAGRVLVKAECEEKSVSVIVTVTDSPEVELLSLSADTASLSLAEGKTKAIIINGLYSDNTKKKLAPEECTWSSSKKSVATVLNGNITAIAGGRTIITATYDYNKSVDIEVTVTDVPKLVSLKANPSYVYIAKGESLPIKITGTYSDGSQKNLTSSCKWKSDNTSVLTVSKGTVKGVAYGTTKVSAEVDSQILEISANVARPSDSTVRLLALTSVTSVTLDPGKSVYMTINGRYSDGSVKSLESECTWSSSDTRVAKVENGRIIGVRAGIATITAVYESRSLDIKVSVISSSGSSQSISASPSSVTVAKGKSTSISVRGKFGDGEKDLSDDCIWSSSDTSVVTVEDGTIKGISVGEATITAVYASKSVSIPVEVVASATLKGLYSISSISVGRGKSLYLVCFGVYSEGTREDVTKNCQWSTSNASVVTVNKGKITGVAAGTAVITAKSGSQSVKITVTVT